MSISVAAAGMQKPIFNYRPERAVSWPFVFVGTLVLVLFANPLVGMAQNSGSAPPLAYGRDQLCPMLVTVAEANALPLEFFARVIWQESHFQSDALGPITRSGERALGIAQFMPGTAVDRGLIDPFNPAEALPKSGALLAELRIDFGNLGLAAAAYNAGPQRVRDFLAGVKDLPEETHRYVVAITGRPVEEWIKLGSEPPAERSRTKSPLNCDQLVALLKATSSQISSLPRRNVPSWCRGLSHPDTAVCGSVHAERSSMPFHADHSSMRLMGRAGLAPRAKPSTVSLH